MARPLVPCNAQPLAALLSFVLLFAFGCGGGAKDGPVVDGGSRSDSDGGSPPAVHVDAGSDGGADAGAPSCEPLDDAALLELLGQLMDAGAANPREVLQEFTLDVWESSNKDGDTGGNRGLDVDNLARLSTARWVEEVAGAPLGALELEVPLDHPIEWVSLSQWFDRAGASLACATFRLGVRLTHGQEDCPLAASLWSKSGVHELLSAPEETQPLEVGRWHELSHNLSRSVDPELVTWLGLRIETAEGANCMPAMSDAGPSGGAPTILHVTTSYGIEAD